MPIIEREPGFYWVLKDGRWTVIEFDGIWHEPTCCEHAVRGDESYYELIGPRIEPPNSIEQAVKIICEEFPKMPEGTLKEATRAKLAAFCSVAEEKRSVLLNKLRQLAAKSKDQESDHIEADELILGYIGDEEISTAFDDIPKWYS